MRLRHLLLICQFVVLSGFTLELFLCGVGANWLFNEPRPVMGCMEDISITREINQKLSDDQACAKTANISATSYNKIVLLTGQTQDEAIKHKAYHYAINIPKVRHVFNQVTIDAPTGMQRRIQDWLLFETIRIKLLLTSSLRYHHFKVITENGEVFILGKAKPEEAELAATTIQNTAYVKKVVKLIEPL